MRMLHLFLLFSLMSIFCFICPFLFSFLILKRSFAAGQDFFLTVCYEFVNYFWALCQKLLSPILTVSQFEKPLKVFLNETLNHTLNIYLMLLTSRLIFFHFIFWADFDTSWIKSPTLTNQWKLAWWFMFPFPFVFRKSPRLFCVRCSLFLYPFITLAVCDALIWNVIQKATQFPDDAVCPVDIQASLERSWSMSVIVLCGTTAQINQAMFMSVVSPLSMPSWLKQKPSNKPIDSGHANETPLELKCLFSANYWPLLTDIKVLIIMHSLVFSGSNEELSFDRPPVYKIERFHF